MVKQCLLNWFWDMPISIESEHRTDLLDGITVLTVSAWRADNENKNMKNLTRPDFIRQCGIAAIVIAVFLMGVSCQKHSAKQPNIMFILIDDMSWKGVGCFGNKLVDTPHIDKLAAEGMKFSSAYVTPICSPTRVELLSGKHSARMHVTIALPGGPRNTKWARYGNPLPSPGIPQDDFTMAEALKAQGYHTGHFGKWHVGLDYTVRNPQQQEIIRNKFGFDVTVANSKKDQRYDRSTTRLTNETIEFIRKSAPYDQPFFAFLSHQTVHTECAAPSEIVQQYVTENCKPAGKFPYEGINNATYLAMIKHLDNETGRLLNTLDELGMEKNTVVVFLSDNGGSARVTDNSPLRRGKVTLYEGGIRVPMIVRWPGVVQQNSTCDVPCTCLS